MKEHLDALLDALQVGLILAVIALMGFAVALHLFPRGYSV